MFLYFCRERRKSVHGKDDDDEEDKVDQDEWDQDETMHWEHTFDCVWETDLKS